MVEIIDTTSKVRILDDNTFQLGDRMKIVVDYEKHKVKILIDEEEIDSSMLLTAVLFKNGMEWCNSGVLRFLGFRSEWGMNFGFDKESK